MCNPPSDSCFLLFQRVLVRPPHHVVMIPGAGMQKGRERSGDPPAKARSLHLVSRYLMIPGTSMVWQGPSRIPIRQQVTRKQEIE